MRRSTHAGLVLLAIVIAGVTFVIPALRRSARAMKHDALVTRPLVSVRNGETQVSIMTVELLHALSADPKCIGNLTEVVFSSVTFNERDERDQVALQNLKNVTSIGFYCCRNVDSILPAINSLPTRQLSFEMADVSPQALKEIRDANTIKQLSFEQNLSEAQVMVLRSFPATIQVTTSFPLDAYD